MPAKCTDGHDYQKTAEVTNVDRRGSRTTTYYKCSRCGDSYST